MYICVYVCLCLYILRGGGTQRSVFACMYSYVHVLCVDTCMDGELHMCLYVSYVNMFMYVHVCMCVYVHACYLQ